MGDSFLKRHSRLQGPAQEGNLCWRQGPRGQLLKGAKGDAIGLAEGSVDGAGFSHTHLGMVEDEGRDVAGVGIAVTDKAAALGRLVDSGFEDPEVLVRSTKWEDRLCQNPTAMVSRRQAQ